MCDDNKCCDKCNKVTESKSVVVYKRDGFSISNYNVTANGYLNISGIVTRDGVFKYEDGNELRPFDEVFKPESLETMFAIPVTWEHPQDLVTVDTIISYQKGFVASKARQDIKDGKNVVVLDSIIIQDPALMFEIKNNHLKEFSLGYTCDLKEVSGNIDGEDYVRSQSNIVYNHLAVVKDARCGDTCSIIERGDSMAVGKVKKVDAKKSDVGSEEKDKETTKEEEGKKEDTSETSPEEEEEGGKEEKKDMEEMPPWASKIMDSLDKLSSYLAKNDSIAEEKLKEKEKEDAEEEEKEEKKTDKKDSFNFSFTDTYSNSGSNLTNEIEVYSREKLMEKLRSKK